MGISEAASALSLLLQHWVLVLLHVGDWCFRQWDAVRVIRAMEMVKGTYTRYTWAARYGSGLDC